MDFSAIRNLGFRSSLPVLLTCLVGACALGYVPIPLDPNDPFEGALRGPDKTTPAIAGQARTNILRSIAENPTLDNLDRMLSARGAACVRERRSLRCTHWKTRRELYYWVVSDTRYLFEVEAWTGRATALAITVCAQTSQSGIDSVHRHCADGQPK